MALDERELLTGKAVRTSELISCWSRTLRGAGSGLRPADLRDLADAIRRFCGLVTARQTVLDGYAGLRIPLPQLPHRCVEACPQDHTTADRMPSMPTR
ncbi:hypothetical protein ACFVXG_00905 [Kitasatospora sp. NPDC058162]|uniref:hypothetical protein n=1 Tax=Kitasatospora sp. NPDC058162 TaxID=3346362 RepID=UPI0036DB79D0